jgi:hypothetical protein
MKTDLKKMGEDISSKNTAVRNINDLIQKSVIPKYGAGGRSPNNLMAL